MNLFVFRAPAALFLMIFSVLFFSTAPAYSQAVGNFRLIGTIEGGSGFTGAVLDDNSGTQNFYRLREPLPDGSWMVKIASDTVTIKRSDGSTYTLFLVQGTKPGAPQPARAAANAAVGTTPVTVPAPEPVRQAPNRQRLNPPPDNPVPGYREAGNADGAAGSSSKMSRKQRRAARRGNTDEE